MQNEILGTMKQWIQPFCSAEFLIGFASAALLSIVIVLIIKLLIKHNQIFLNKHVID
jgi:hypothetical protein